MNSFRKKDTMYELLTFYLAAINIAGFLAMGIDKKKAARHEWRIPERVLFGIALLGGSIGSLAGMHAFRHKTRHLTFTIGLPLILVLQVMIFQLLRRYV